MPGSGDQASQTPQQPYLAVQVDITEALHICNTNSNCGVVSAPPVMRCRLCRCEGVRMCRQKGCRWTSRAVGIRDRPEIVQVLQHVRDRGMGLEGRRADCWFDLAGAIQGREKESRIPVE